MPKWRPTSAWVAGFFDGEGCVSVTSNRLYTSVVQSKREILDKLAKEYGGAVYSNRSWFQWRLNGQHCEHFLRDMLPYLFVKKKAVLAALEFIATIGGQTTEEERKIRMKAHRTIRKENARKPKWEKRPATKSDKK